MSRTRKIQVVNADKQGREVTNPTLKAIRKQMTRPAGGSGGSVREEYLTAGLRHGKKRKAEAGRKRLATTRKRKQASESLCRSLKTGEESEMSRSD